MQRGEHSDANAQAGGSCLILPSQWKFNFEQFLLSADRFMPLRSIFVAKKNYGTDTELNPQSQADHLCKHAYNDYYTTASCQSTAFNNIWPAMNGEGPSLHQFSWWWWSLGTRPSYQNTFQADIMPRNALAHLSPRAPTLHLIFSCRHMLASHMSHVCFTYIDLSKIVLFCWVQSCDSCL